MRKEVILVIFSIILVSCSQKSDSITSSLDCSDNFGKYTLSQSIELYSNSDIQTTDLYVFNLDKNLINEKKIVEEKISAINDQAVYNQIISKEDIDKIRKIVEDK